MDLRSPRAKHLPTVRVASPCDEPWTGMAGNHAARRCARCQTTVHALGARSDRDVAALLSSPAERPCVRIAVGRDGAMLRRVPRPVLRKAVLLSTATWLALVSGCATRQPGSDPANGGAPRAVDASAPRAVDAGAVTEPSPASADTLAVTDASAPPLATGAAADASAPEAAAGDAGAGKARVIRRVRVPHMVGIVAKPDDSIPGP